LFFVIGAAGGTEWNTSPGGRFTWIKFNIPATDEEYSTQPALCLENLNIGVPNNWIAIN
jgi:hypothetical protein